MSTKLKKLLLFFGALLLLLVAAYAAFLFSPMFDVDRCLDGGGAWREGQCVFDDASLTPLAG